MIQYVLTATTLKAFSSCPQTRRIYRKLGNTIGSRKRERGDIPGHYISRINHMLQSGREHGIPRDGMQLLEIGTGWLHWEAITCRLFFDFNAVLFDIWDNRQIRGLKHYLLRLKDRLDIVATDTAQKHTARERIDQILKIDDYTKLYDFLGFQYVVDPEGRLGKLGREQFDIIVSAGVLEHIPRQYAMELAEDISALLKPGGHSMHSINIRDHLYPYDQSVSPKQYLAFTERAWKMFFENHVQYINRIQRSEWLELFRTAGLNMLSTEIQNVPIENLKISRRFRDYDPDDLKCGGLKMLHVKPEAQIPG